MSDKATTVSAARTSAARGFLERRAAMGSSKCSSEEWHGGPFDVPWISDLMISHVEPGAAFCSYRIPAHAAGIDGSWQAGAIAAMMDNVGAAAVMTTEGIIKLSVDVDISFFSPVKAHEEVEINARVVGHKGKLSAMVIQVRKKGSGELVAMGRQWMASGRPIDEASKL